MVVRTSDKGRWSCNYFSVWSSWRCGGTLLTKETIVLLCPSSDADLLTSGCDTLSGHRDATLLKGMSKCISFLSFYLSAFRSFALQRASTNSVSGIRKSSSLECFETCSTWLYWIGIPANEVHFVYLLCKNLMQLLRLKALKHKTTLWYTGGDICASKCINEASPEATKEITLPFIRRNVWDVRQW